MVRASISSSDSFPVDPLAERLTVIAEVLSVK